MKNNQFFWKIEAILGSNRKRCFFTNEKKVYKKISGIMGSQTNNSVWSRNQHFLKLFFIPTRGNAVG